MNNNKISSILLRIWYPDTFSSKDENSISIFSIIKKFLIKILLNLGSKVYKVALVSRKTLFKLNIFKSHQFNIPVIVVGNLTVGGTGKTPCVIELVKLLQKIGLKPAVIIRGYSRSLNRTQSTKKSFLIDENTSIYKSGDEARVIFNATGCPVVVGSNRVNSIKLILTDNLANIVISDDGLQHYKMARDLEICIVDNSRMFGNSKLLPAGPLREPVARLNECNYILSKINNIPKDYSELGYNKLLNNPNCTFNIFTLLLSAVEIVNLVTGKSCKPQDFIDRYISIANNHNYKVYAFAGIGNNDNFFNTLSSLNINNIRYREFIDHYNYQVQDFKLIENPNNIIITTEKDAVKINFLKNNIVNANNIFYLSICASFDFDFMKMYIMDVVNICAQYGIDLDLNKVVNIIKSVKNTDNIVESNIEYR